MLLLVVCLVVVSLHLVSFCMNTWHDQCQDHFPDLSLVFIVQWTFFGLHPLRESLCISLCPYHFSCARESVVSVLPPNVISASYVGVLKSVFA